MAKKAEAAVYAVNSELVDLAPMIESRTATKEEILSTFMSQALLVEGAAKEPEKKGEAEVLAEASKPEGQTMSVTKGEESMTRTYSLTYFNPMTNKAEVVEAKVDIRIADYTQRTVEESVGIGSVIPLYAFIATPMIRTEVVQWRLEEILKEREYGTPPDFGAASAVKVVKPEQVKAGKISEVVPLTQGQRQDAIARESVIEALVRKEDGEKKLDSEIVVFENVVAAIRKGAGTEDELGKLPPLSKARYLALLRKKRIQREALISLLARDLRFLRSVRKKLGTLTIEELLGMVRALKKRKGK
jgi:hypothetical protein